MLSDTGIRTALALGAITITPFTAAAVQPASVDLHLDDRFAVFDTGHRTHIDPREALEVRTVRPPAGQAFVLHPGEFVLGATAEVVGVDAAIAARYETKSSIARLGLASHFAGFIDPGFTGAITLELANVSQLPILLWPGMAIGQVCFFALDAPAASPYGAARGSHYQGQVGPTASMAHAQHAERIAGTRSERF